MGIKTEVMAGKLLDLYRQWVDEGRPKGGEKDGACETAQESAETMQAG